MKVRFAISILLLGFVLSISAKADDKFVCPVTKPTPVTFEKTGTFSREGKNLFGTEKLFTLLTNWGTTPTTGPSYVFPKIVWGTTTVDLHREVSQSTLTITGRRLDAEAGPLQFEGAHTAWMDEPQKYGPVPGVGPTPVAEIDRDQFFITSGFSLPTSGCWEVTGHFHGTDLKIVLELSKDPATASILVSR